MKLFSRFGLTAAALFMSWGSMAQGDSDPGMSTVGALRSGSVQPMGQYLYESEKTQLTVSHAMANGERGVVIQNPRLGMRIPLLSDGYLDLRMEMQAVYGELADIAGLGDLMVAYTYRIPPVETPLTWQFTGGFKLATGNATLTDGKNRPLPMAYQPSWGTTDLILGVNMWVQRYFSVALGYQQPIINYNDNLYTGFSADNEILYSDRDYPLSKRLYRFGDLMLRAEGHYSGDRAGISAGPLLFYHLGDDLYEYVDGRTYAHEGSKGFSLNVSGNAFVRFGRYGSWKLELSGGLPLFARDVHPDGSMRSWILIPGISYFFNQESVMFN